MRFSKTAIWRECNGENMTKYKASDSDFFVSLTSVPVELEKVNSLASSLKERTYR